MRKLLLFTILIFSSGINMLLSSHATRPANGTEDAMTEEMLYTNMYESLHLDDKLSKEAFFRAIAGYYNIKGIRHEILTIIDFSKPSNSERMFVIDMKNMKVLFSTVVSHGRNSGKLYATSFSNKNGSYKSSLGFYITGNTYKGKNGYSLVLDGLESGINDNAKERAIVMHGAWYCNPDVVRTGGILGRSLGCPAIPEKLTRPIIDTIKDGSVLFIYADNPTYLTQSKIIEKKQIMQL